MTATPETHQLVTLCVAIAVPQSLQNAGAWAQQALGELLDYAEIHSVAVVAHSDPTVPFGTPDGDLSLPAPWGDYEFGLCQTCGGAITADNRCGC